MVERTGVNVDQLVELLVKNAAAELTTFYYYTMMFPRAPCGSMAAIRRFTRLAGT